MSDDHFHVTWIDHGREPQVKPNPAYPNGIDVDATSPLSRHTCKAALPYPARRCGMYHIQCTLCGGRFACTTAGRPDDPRSMKVECRRYAA